MKNDLYLTQSDIPVAHGHIPAGKLVYCQSSAGKTTVSTLDRKYSCSIPEKSSSSFLKKCKATCGTKYTLIMILNTSYHTYTAIGRDLSAMYEKIVSMYNNNAGTKYTIDNFASCEEMETERIHVYRIPNDLIWFDDEYYSLPDDEYFLGEYFSLYRKSTWPFRGKNWFNESMM